MKKIPIYQPSVTELEISYAVDAVKNGWGENCYAYIKRFEKDFAAYTGSSYSLATSSCTGAIHLALAAMGVKAGDEVIMGDINWIASAAPITYLGAKPVFVDVLEDSWCIDPSKIEAAITEKTKVILAVDLYGNLAEMDQIVAIAKKHNLYVLEDAAEALGSVFRGKKAGSWGDIGVFSFHGAKIMTTGEGGMLVTDNAALMERVRILSDHGRDPKVNRTFWMAELGYKYKMSNLQAAMGCAQLERVDELVNKRRDIFNWYTEYLADLPGIVLNPEPSYTINCYWMPTIVFDKALNIEAHEVINYLKEQNIDSRPFFYPLSSLPMFEKAEENKVSYNLYKRALNLPSNFSLTREDIKQVCQAIRTYVNKVLVPVN
ncbi:DegT/DnrJ/EryC1/StrS family aminotransferase [Rhodocytophaga rosea]|uniref:DegT/DnrJ/EryC1/StrS family aminotransferase n=1 Tax=Rhodocytophaga rosea TaxID=2704465 RepID=A0A6C0GQ62_9BACT|nr:DegT/DnrJ/EryC1/StrS family aminotransferase [Rhodocytophaga rosea]QHT70206.1 DegT/DnrJ/EryC1/StrS family aminotransferase [Rhodocytophaga rosea]